jgi:hypothetical protein
MPMAQFPLRCHVRLLVPPGRLELPLRCRKQILSLPRLPIPPQGHFADTSQRQQERAG